MSSDDFLPVGDAVGAGGEGRLGIKTPPLGFTSFSPSIDGGVASISGDPGGDASARICGSSDRGSNNQSLGRNFRLETEDFCLVCFVFALEGAESSGISGIFGTGGIAEGLVSAASVPGCRVEVRDGFLDKGELSLLKLMERAAFSSTGDTLGELFVSTDVAAMIDGRTEFVCVFRCN